MTDSEQLKGMSPKDLEMMGLTPSTQESPEARPILDDQEKLSITQSLKLQEESMKTLRVRQEAKKKGVEPAQLLKELRDFAKSRIQDPNAKHFHRTDIDSFKQIVEDGALLSRTEIKKLHPERQLSPYSASDSVMMTRDLERYGLNLGPGRGKGVVFVLGPELINQDSYDTLSHYPTVDNAPLDKTVTAVLVDDDADIQVVKDILAKRNLAHIEVVNRNKWLDEQKAKKQ
jgi:hypothetical protein